jgi:MiaB/RimO family radical SAM methylthiotransferase
MKTFSITTLGCRVNHYESEQLATLLRNRGLLEAPADQADVRIVHTCSVTIQAASKSRQTVRRNTRLNILNRASDESSISNQQFPIDPYDAGTAKIGRSRVVVTGCWASSHPSEAANLPGVDAVLGHGQDVNKELTRLLTQWEREDQTSHSPAHLNLGVMLPELNAESVLPKPDFDEVWMTQKAGTLAALITTANEPYLPLEVNGKLEADENSCEEWNEVAAPSAGMVTLPQLGQRQTGHQRAFLKVQDGCDAHCTYCIIPQLRPTLWSKPIDEAVAEAQRLVNAGHVEIVLTGIFLGAYGQPTALRRRQVIPTARPLAELVDALCTRVRGLGRLRLSSLEPGDLTDELIEVLKSHPQVVPHFHLPLQSGSDLLLKRMNRQYSRDDFLGMARQVKAAFDRPALTTDIIVGFPGETAEEFGRTLEVVNEVGFIHIHAFSYSPRPKTAAARWTRQAVHGPVVNERINHLGELSAAYSLSFRRQFVDQTVEVLVERSSGSDRDLQRDTGYQHGRCERYFDVHFDNKMVTAGAQARVRIDRVTSTRTFGTLLEVTT